MAQPDFLKLAQQGDPGAIARLLNRTLQPRGVNAKVLLKEDCLKVLLLSERPLEQQAFTRFLQNQLIGLNLESVTQVKVYGQRSGEVGPSWSQEFVLPTAARLSRSSALVP